MTIIKIKNNENYFLKIYKNRRRKLNLEKHVRILLNLNQSFVFCPLSLIYPLPFLHDPNKNLSIRIDFAK